MYVNAALPSIIPPAGCGIARGLEALDRQAHLSAIRGSFLSSGCTLTLTLNTENESESGEEERALKETERDRDCYSIFTRRHQFSLLISPAQV